MVQLRLSDQRGITGLETAIILIAFVVVASVFAYTVLSAGIFASERSKEAANAGIETVSSSLELTGEVKADGQPATTLAAIDGAGEFAAASGVTVATESADHKTEPAAVQVSIAGAFTSGLVASTDLGVPVDLSDHFAASLWIKPDSTVAAGTFQLLIDDNAGCGSPEETLDLPSLTANTWVKPRLKLADPASLTAVACVGISAPSDPGAVTLLVDQFEGPPEVQSVYFALSNTLRTEAIAFLTTADSNGDGLLSDELAAGHYTIVSFVNDETIVRDLAWDYTELGMSDGDINLEYGESFLLRVDLRAVDPIPTTRSLLGIEIAPHGGAPISIEKLAPSQITSSMILR